MEDGCRGGWLPWRMVVVERSFTVLPDGKGFVCWRGGGGGRLGTGGASGRVGDG